MGLVTEALIALLRKQVEAHGTVVWYDPEHAYLDLAPSLAADNLSGAGVHRYDPERGFLWLRRRLEPLWAEKSHPPKLLLYVPLAQAEAKQALVEFEVAGVVVQPGQQPPERNSALAAVGRQALSAVFPPAAVEEIVAQVEAGQLSLAELDRLAEQGAEAHTGAVAVIFGSGNVSDVAVRFLSSPALDAELEARQALGSLAGLMANALGVSFGVGGGPAGLRAELARQVLVTDLVEGLRGTATGVAGAPVPPALQTFRLASSQVARRAAVDLAQTWRVRRDLAAGYVEWANRVQAEIGAASFDLGLDALARTEAFAACEVRLQAEVEKALLRRALPSLVALAQGRLSGFWSAQVPEIKTRWEVIADAGRVLVEAARLENDLKGKSWPAGALLSGYAYARSAAGGEQPWCALDTAQRHLERDFHRFDLDPGQHGSLQQLVTLARQRYTSAADRLAELWTQAFAEVGFELPGVLLQADVYRDVVAPALQSGRTAYLLVDALRFEMARELLTVLEADWATDLTLALATPPAVTEIGMAALLPGAERGLTVAAAGGNKLAAVVGGQRLATRQDRMSYLQATVGVDVAVTKLDQLAPLSDVHLGQALKAARLVAVTATEEIDGLCETNPALARRMLDDVFNQLRRGIKTLFSAGIETVVIAADHGYLFGEELSAGQKIDAPGGKTAALKRRVWLGHGGAQQPGVLYRPLSAFGLGGDLEMATPLSLSCFKAKGGATEYFHGGLSLPELVIPVLTVRSGTGPAPTEAAPIEWTLVPGSRTISTRFVSVIVQGRSRQLLPVEPPAVRVEVRAKGQPISVPVSASYGFQETTKDVQLALEEGGPPQAIAQNTVTLMVTETPEVDQVTIHLLDATTGMSLARLDGVPFAIAL